MFSHICLHRLLSGLLIVSQTLTTDFVSDAKTKLQCSGWTWNNRSTCKSVSSSMRTMTCFRQFKSCTDTETISIVSSMKCLKSVLLQDLLSLLTKSCLKQRHIKVYTRSFPPRWVTCLAEGPLVSFIDDYCFPEPSENKVYIHLHQMIKHFSHARRYKREPPSMMKWLSGGNCISICLNSYHNYHYVIVIV